MNRTYRVDMDTFRKDWPVLVLLLGSLVLGALVLPYLPERVPAHWNLRGEVDRYGSRLWGAFGIPLLNLAVYTGMLLLPLIDPRRENYPRFEGAYRLLRAALVTFLAGLYLLVLLAGLGYRVDVGRLVQVGLSLLFILIGNFLGQIRHNYFVGIRTPWTLASEEVWQKTHRVAARAFVLAGLAGAAGAIPGGPVGAVVTTGALLAATVYSVVYSCLLFARLNRRP